MLLITVPIGTPNQQRKQICPVQSITKYNIEEEKYICQHLRFNTLSKLCDLEHLFPEFETKTGAFCLQCFCQVRVSAVKDCHFPLIFLADSCEDFVPIRSACDCPSLQTRDKVSLWLKHRLYILTSVTLLPSGVTARGPVEAQQPSCRSSAGRRWCTCACPGTWL